MNSIHGLALFVALVLNASANLMMKVGMNRVQTQGGLLKSGVVSAVLTIISSPILVIGLVCFGLNAAFYMFALQSPALKISLAYPMMVGGGFAIIAVAAFAFLGERLNGWQMIGVALILSGVFLVATQTSTPDSV